MATRRIHKQTPRGAIDEEWPSEKRPEVAVKGPEQPRKSAEDCGNRKVKLATKCGQPGCLIHKRAATVNAQAATESNS